MKSSLMKGAAMGHVRERRVRNQVIMM